ncbi:MAG TPA: hypothetical protein VFD58_19410 [Blastocatellia bacterium]|nr:hypothetical protein [Blastocatellia bacterium]
MKTTFKFGFKRDPLTRGKQTCDFHCSQAESGDEVEEEKEEMLSQLEGRQGLPEVSSLPLT